MTNRRINSWRSRVAFESDWHSSVKWFMLMLSKQWDKHQVIIKAALRWWIKWKHSWFMSLAQNWRKQNWFRCTGRKSVGREWRTKNQHKINLNKNKFDCQKLQSIFLLDLACWILIVSMKEKRNWRIPTVFVTALHICVWERWAGPTGEFLGEQEKRWKITFL